MSEEKEPVARIELTGYTCTEDVEYLINKLNGISPYSLDYVPNPEGGEPDFYLNAEIEGDDNE